MDSRDWGPSRHPLVRFSWVLSWYLTFVEAHSADKASVSGAATSLGTYCSPCLKWDASHSRSWPRTVSWVNHKWQKVICARQVTAGSPPESHESRTERLADKSQPRTIRYRGLTTKVTQKPHNATLCKKRKVKSRGEKKQNRGTPVNLNVSAKYFVKWIKTHFTRFPEWQSTHYWLPDRFSW